MISARPSNLLVSVVLGVGVLAVSTAAVLIRLSLAEAEVEGIGFSLVLSASRLVLASLVLAPTWRSVLTSPQTFASPGWKYSLAAGLCLAAHFTVWTTSLSYTSIAAAATLVTTNPVWVALLSWWLFKEKPSVVTGLGMAIALAGGLVVSLSGSDGASQGSAPLLGNALALLGAWTMSGYFLLTRSAQRQGLSTHHHVTLAYSTAALLLLPLPGLFGTSYMGYPKAVYGYIVLLALVPQLIGHTSFNWAIRWVSPTLVTLTILAEPVGAGLLGFLIFGERLGLATGIGAGVLLVGVAIAALGSRQQTVKAG